MSDWCCRLRQVDVELMQTLQDRVNLVPVIAKSDTLTKREVATLKSRVRFNFAQRRPQEFFVFFLSIEGSKIPWVWVAARDPTTLTKLLDGSARLLQVPRVEARRCPWQIQVGGGGEIAIFDQYLGI